MDDTGRRATVGRIGLPYAHTARNPRVGETPRGRLWDPNPRGGGNPPAGAPGAFSEKFAKGALCLAIRGSARVGMDDASTMATVGRIGAPLRAHAREECPGGRGAGQVRMAWRAGL
jgi:hypothetical protein